MHQGAHFYTIGQRKGLQIGGRPLPSFAVQIDVENNIVYSCQGDDHPALNRWALKIAKKRHQLDPISRMGSRTGV